MELQKQNTLIGKPQTYRIRNRTYARGTHDPRTKPNDLNYELGMWASTIWATIMRMSRENSYAKIYGTMHGLS